METTEKLALLEEMMELDAGILATDTVLECLEAWDSMAAIALIALVDENFGRKLTASQIRDFTTVKDILDIMV